ncbi:MAG: glycosyltransferase [Rhizomicrobium sp.]
MSRILVVDGAGNLWGSERALLDLLDAVEGTPVAVCCPPGRPLVPELEKRHVEVLPYFIYRLHEKGRLARLRAAIGVMRACARFRPDVIYLNQSGAFRITLLAAVLFGLPIVAHVRLHEDAAYLAKQKPKPWRLRAIVAISETVKAEIRRFKQLEAFPVHMIYDGYAASPPAQNDAALRVPGQIACVGRLDPAKGQHILIGALGVLSKQGTPLKCLFAGAGATHYWNELKELTRRLRLEDAVVWLGFLNDVRPLMRSCSVLVCPSQREGLGRVIFEAWDAGCVPVVFGDGGGPAEIVRASGGGLIYADQTPDSLAAALQRALALDDAEKADLVAAGREWMAKNCHPSDYGIAMSAVLESAVVQSERVI